MTKEQLLELIDNISRKLPETHNPDSEAAILGKGFLDDAKNKLSQDVIPRNTVRTLYFAVVHLNMVDELNQLMRIAPPSQHQIDKLLHLAIEKDLFETTVYLVKMRGANVNSIVSGDAPLHRTIRFDSKSEPRARIAKFLLQHGANPGIRNVYKLTPGEMTSWEVPTLDGQFERLIGIKSQFNPHRDQSYGEHLAPTVRPILNKYQNKRGLNPFFSPQAKELKSSLRSLTNPRKLELFKIIQAMKGFIKSGTPGFGFPDFATLSAAIAKVSMPELVIIENNLFYMHPKLPDTRFVILHKFNYTDLAVALVIMALVYSFELEAARILMLGALTGYMSMFLRESRMIEITNCLITGEPPIDSGLPGRRADMLHQAVAVTNIQLRAPMLMSADPELDQFHSMLNG